MTGILNGIDTEGYNPETDPLIYKTYSADDPSGQGGKQAGRFRNA